MLLTQEVQDEYRRRYGGPDGDAAPVAVADFLPPVGRFFVGYAHERPVAMGGWRRGGPAGGDAEIKRMYVRPYARGHGYARAMLQHLEDTAGAAGVERLVLETGLEQPEAIGLYRSAGYVPIAPFGYYADYPDSVHLAKPLPVHRSSA